MCMNVTTFKTFVKVCYGYAKVFAKHLNTIVHGFKVESTVCLKKNVPLVIVHIFAKSNVNRFSKFFHGTFAVKSAIKLFVNIPPHFNGVAALPCEIQL